MTKYSVYTRFFGGQKGGSSEPPQTPLPTGLTWYRHATANKWPHHAVNPATTRVKEINSKLSKRAREEMTPAPTLYNEALVEISTQPDCSDRCSSNFISYSSFKSSIYRSRRKRDMYMVYILVLL